MDSVRDKIVLITGASSGIGASTAVAFAKYGSSLALTGRDGDKLHKVALQCAAQGLAEEKILEVTGDMEKDDDIKRLVDATVEKFGGLNVLVNSAGFCPVGSLQASPMEVIDRTYRMNIRAICYLTKLAIPYLKQNGGCVVNISSTASTCPSAGAQMFAYTFSKTALDEITRSLALELGPDKIRVISVNPGFVKTPIFRNTFSDQEAIDEFLGKMATRTATGTIAAPEEVAGVIVFLASEAASLITGTNIVVDAGLCHFGAWST